MRCGEGTHENVRSLVLVVQLVEELVDSSVLVRQLVNAKEVQIPIHGQHERPRKKLAPRRRRRSEGEDRVNKRRPKGNKSANCSAAGLIRLVLVAPALLNGARKFRLLRLVRLQLPLLLTEGAVPAMHREAHHTSVDRVQCGGLDAVRRGTERIDVLLHRRHLGQAVHAARDQRRTPCKKRQARAR